MSWWATRREAKKGGKETKNIGGLTKLAAMAEDVEKMVLRLRKWGAWRYRWSSRSGSLLAAYNRCKVRTAVVEHT